MTKEDFLQELSALPPTFVPEPDWSTLRYTTPNGRTCPITAVAEARFGVHYDMRAFTAGQQLGLPRLLILEIMEAADDPRFWDGPFKRRIRRIHKAQRMLAYAQS